MSILDKHTWSVGLKGYQDFLHTFILILYHVFFSFYIYCLCFKFIYIQLVNGVRSYKRQMYVTSQITSFHILWTSQVRHRVIWRYALWNIRSDVSVTPCRWSRTSGSSRCMGARSRNEITSAAGKITSRRNVVWEYDAIAPPAAAAAAAAATVQWQIPFCHHPIIQWGSYFAP